MWQDYVFFAGTIIMTIFLIPTLIQDEKPARSTSAIIGAILIVFGYLFFTLNMYWTFVFTTIEGILWFILLYQKVRKEWLNTSKNFM